MKSARLRIILLLVSALFFSCSGQRLTQANVDQVTEGMSKKQVESILGPPTAVETKDCMLQLLNIRPSENEARFCHCCISGRNVSVLSATKGLIGLRTSWSYSRSTFSNW